MAQIVLDDPVLDARHPFTRVFLAAEYWKKRYLQLKHERNFMREHQLKTWPVYFEEIASGRLSFSIRDNDGRAFQKGDSVTLREWDPDKQESIADVIRKGAYTGRYMLLTISYVESGWGLQPGKVALAFAGSSERVVWDEQERPL